MTPFVILYHFFIFKTIEKDYRLTYVGQLIVWWWREWDFFLPFCNTITKTQTYGCKKSSVTAKTVGVHRFLTLFQIPLHLLSTTKKEPTKVSSFLVVARPLT